MLEVREIGIVADDLTGACDVAACFAAKLGAAEVSIVANVHSTGDSPLQILNTQTRLQDAMSARETLRRVGSLLADKRFIFKKIDAGLRGPIGAELAGLLDGLSRSALPWACVVAPAALSIGRTTRGGIQFDHGIPVDQSDLSHDPGSPPLSADIRVVLARTGGGTYTVADAECPEDLDRIVETRLSQGRVVFAGSLGLALALANRFSGTFHHVMAAIPACYPLLVCGSRHPLSAIQIERARGENVRILSFDPAVRSFDDAIKANRDYPLLARIGTSDQRPQTGSPDDMLASFTDALCTLLKQINPDGLGVIGGETAYHVLRELGTSRLEVFQRHAEVITHSRIGGGIMDGCPFVCKGGSVGPDDSVLRMLSLLKGGRN